MFNAPAPPEIYSSTNAGPQLTARDSYRIIWIRSSQKATLDRHVRMQRLHAAELEIQEIGRSIARRLVRSRKEIETRIRLVLTNHHVRAFLHVRIVAFVEVEHRYLRRGRPQPGDPMQTIRHRRFRLTISLAQAALHRH